MSVKYDLLYAMEIAKQWFFATCLVAAWAVSATIFMLLMGALLVTTWLMVGLNRLFRPR